MGQHPGPANTIGLYIGPMGDPVSSCTLSCFALPALVKSGIDHYIVDLSLGVSREFTIKGLVQVYHCTPLPPIYSLGDSLMRRLYTA